MTKKYDPYEDVRDPRSQAAADDWREITSKFWRYLRTRPMECWGFFIAGLLIGGLLF